MPLRYLILLSPRLWRLFLRLPLPLRVGAATAGLWLARRLLVRSRSRR